jgi:hypothetical protein
MIKRAFKYGRTVDNLRIPTLDLVIEGAIDIYGKRLGEGGG